MDETTLPFRHTKPCFNTAAFCKGTSCYQEKSRAMTSLGDDLLNTVNKLQDLVFNTIGNDSLDLPQIVCFDIRRGQKCIELTHP